MNIPSGKPIHKLPANVERAVRFSYIHNSIGYKMAVYQTRGDRALNLMTWAAAFTLADVKRFSLRKFVWVGVVNSEKGPRDNFEEKL